MDNREKLLECATNLFYEKGYDAVGVQEIVEKAGMTKPTMYYYFKSKYGLLENILESYFEPYLKRLEVAAEYRGDIPSTLHRTCREQLKIALENRKMYMFAFSLMYSARENDTYQAVRPYMVRINEIIVKIFNDASEKLGNMNGRQQQFASGFEGIINYYLMYYFETDCQDTDTDEISMNLVKQFMYGIYT